MDLSDYNLSQLEEETFRKQPEEALGVLWTPQRLPGEPDSKLFEMTPILSYFVDRIT